MRLHQESRGTSAGAWARAVAAALACAATMAGAAPPRPDTGPSLTPQVRVVQPMHTAPVAQIRTDARFERLLTSSSDKTLRLWRLADFQLLRTIHLPSEPGPEGTPYAIALSADGRRAYAAGYTGWHWHRAAHIYLVDVDGGRISGKVGSFPGEVVTALDLSPDGRRLAVGLGRGGLVVIDATSGARLQADAAYAAPVTFVHHAADGRLATTAADGCLRLYAADGRLVYRNQFPALAADQPQCSGGELGGVRFSPDGKWLALGSRAAPEVGLFDAAGLQLSLRRTVRIPDGGQRSLCCIAWSPDSRTLYVNGSVEGDRPTPVYRIQAPASGAPERWDTRPQQITNMLPMPDGSVVLATTVPSISRIAATGRPAVRPDGTPLAVAPDHIDFHRSRAALDHLRVSADGRVVAFEAQPGRWLRASPLAADPSSVLSLLDGEPGGSQDPALSAVRRSGAVSVRTAVGVFAHHEPTLVNGQPVALGFEEDVRSWAVHARLPVAALGTQWRLHLVDHRGQPLPGWEEPPFVPAPIHHTVITEDGRWVVVALGDGTLRWFEIASGRERLGLFVHANLSDWVAWRPEGHYASSPQGDRFVGWLVNRGEAQTPDFFRADQFERTLYRPDLLQAAFTGEPGREATGVAESFRLAPRVHIDDILPASREVRFTVEGAAGQAAAARVAEVGLYADGVPVLNAAARKVTTTAATFTRTVRIPDSLSMDAIRVEAEAAGVLGVDEAGAVQAAEVVRARKGRLWLLAVGVGHFEDFAGCAQTKVCLLRLADLPNAPHDAQALAERLAQAANSTFTEVHLRLLTDGGGPGMSPPTKQAVMNALAWLQGAAPEDTVAVFMASHGIAGGPGHAEYYFLPADAQVEAVEWALAPGAALGHADSLISASELADGLRRVAGRRLLMIDTCHAGAADSPSNPHSLAKRSASAQVAVLAASTGREQSYEAVDPGVHHGAFTQAVLRGLQGLADRDGNGWVTVDELASYVGPEVARNTARLNEALRERNPRHRDVSQTPTLIANPVLRGSALMAVPRGGS